MMFLIANAAVMLTPCPEARRSLHKLQIARDTGNLRRLRNAIEIGAERDHRLARAPGRHPRGWNARHTLAHGEAVLLEDAADVLRRLEILKAELTDAEDLIDELLRELRARIDVAHCLGLERGEPGIRTRA